MKTLFLALSCWVLLMACGSKESAKPRVADGGAKNAAPEPLRTVRVFVAPFSDVDRKDMDYFALGLPLFATARLEELSNDPAAAKAMADLGIAFEAVTGPHVLPEESAKLALIQPENIPLATIYAAAKQAGATHVLTGLYAGRVEKWKLTVALYEVGPDTLRNPVVVSAEKMIYASARSRPAPARPGIQGDVVHAMLGAEIVDVFATDGIVLPDAYVKALSTPQTPDIVSFINLSRAYRALLLGEGDASMKAALAYAENAVKIWPRYQIARRFYAWLLWQIDRPEKARLHFQEALKDDPNDVRALIALGRVELGTGQYDAARERLEAAAALRPKDPVVHYWLGAAYAQLNRVDDAIKWYEMSRQLAPDNVDTHRALAGLYAGERRYADAAIALQFVVDKEPENRDALYLLAACHRAAGHLDEALAAYDLGLSRAPNDEKLLALRRKAAEGVGAKLHAFLAQADALRSSMETHRQDIQAALNDGTWLLGEKKKDACADGLAGSDYLFARKIEDAYDAEGVELQKYASEIRTAFKNADGLALTPDENALAEDLLLYEQKALRDYREIRTAHNGTFASLLNAYGCDLDSGNVRMATIGEIRKRNDERYVTMPEPPRRDSSGISPVVPNGAVDSVAFYVQNDTAKEIVIVLDGRALEPSVPPHQQGEKLLRYSTSIGLHQFCHVGKSDAPKCVGTNLRSSLINEGLVYRVRGQ